MKKRLPTRKEFVILLLPIVLIGIFPLYQSYIQKNKDLLQGKWIITDQGGYSVPGQVCSINFFANGISETECKGGKIGRMFTDSKTRCKYQLVFGKIYFSEGKIISSSPGADWHFGLPDHMVYFKFENNSLISVTHPAVNIVTATEISSFTESTSEWRKIK